MVLVLMVLEVTDPQLWSPDSPSLYRVDVMVWRDCAPIDSAQVPCGFRSIRFDPDLGFFLNDRPLKLQGTCNYEDHAGVGVAVPDASGNFESVVFTKWAAMLTVRPIIPPAPEFLEACDRLGMLVMNENRNFNHTPEYLGQLSPSRGLGKSSAMAMGITIATIRSRGTSGGFFTAWRR